MGQTAALWLTLALVMGLSSASQAQQPWDAQVEVPSGVRYKKADASVNRQAVERIREVLAAKASSSRHLFGSTIVICGPFMWHRLSTLPALGGGVPAAFKVPDHGRELVADGRGFPKDPGKRDAVEAELRQELARDGDLSVRKLRPPELQLLWAIYPFDLEEPLFIVESPHHQFVITFHGDEGMFVDDFFQADRSIFRAQTATGPATPGAIIHTKSPAP